MSTHEDDIEIAMIKIGPQYRKDLGDLAGLAASIEKLTLLQSIGITSDNELIFGYRRLLACRDILHRTYISAKIIDVPSIVEGTYAENEIREDYTPSERLAIMTKIEEEIGNRQGRRTDQLPGDRPEVAGPGEETRDAAARLAGFTSERNARRVQTVLDKGSPELREALDNGEIKPDAAVVIADEPHERQAEIVNMPKQERRDTVRQLRGKAPVVRTRKPPQEMLHLPRLTPEEVGMPENATLAERAAHQKIYGKAQVTPKKIRDLQLAQMAISQLTTTLIALTHERQCSPEQFFEHIDLLLAHQRQPGKKDGSEVDYAKHGKDALTTLGRELGRAIIRLGEFRQMLAERGRKGMPQEAPRSAATAGEQGARAQ